MRNQLFDTLTPTLSLRERARARVRGLNEKGFSLLASILAMMGLAVMGVFFASAVTQHQYSAVNELRSTQALYLTEAGFEMIIQELLDNQDYSFNGAGTDGVIGEITDVPLGAGTVSVTKETGSPPVFTSTGTVGDIRRVVAMTMDVKNLVINDPVFNDVANLGTNWPEALPTNSAGTSGIDTNALKIQTTAGGNQDFTSYREQTLDQAIPPNSRVGVRLSYMRDRTGASNTVNRHTLEVRLVRTDGSVETPWSIGPGTVSDTDNGVWLAVDVRGWETSSTLAIDRIRLFYDLGTGGAALETDQAFGWFDDIAVNIVGKGAWTEP